MEPKESLEIISKVITQTKENLIVQRFYYLLWGWSVTLASLTNYLLIKFSNFEYNFLPWLILMPLAAIISVIYSKKSNVNKPYFTYLEQLLKYLWIVIFISMTISLVISLSIKIFPSIFILVLAGVGTLISGLSLKYKPLIVGGILFFVFSIITIYVDDLSKLLINSLAMIFGYLIPAYMFKNK